MMKRMILSFWDKQKVNLKLPIKLKLRQVKVLRNSCSWNLACSPFCLQAFLYSSFRYDLLPKVECTWNHFQASDLKQNELEKYSDVTGSRELDGDITTMIDSNHSNSNVIEVGNSHALLDINYFVWWKSFVSCEKKAI